MDCAGRYAAPHCHAFKYTNYKGFLV